MKNSVKRLVEGAVIAALYFILTLLSSTLGLSSGVIQFRLSEMLCILPLFTPAAIPGLTLGCFLSNLITGCLPWDILFGTIATLLGAIGSYMLRKNPFLSLIPPVISNTIIIPFVLKYVYSITNTITPLLFLFVFLGEVVCCYVGGIILYYSIKPYSSRLFHS